MFRTTITTFLCLPLLTASIACGGPAQGAQTPVTTVAASEPAPPAPSSVDSPSQPTGHLGLADVQVVGASRDISVFADGRVVVDDKEVGMLHTDGRFVADGFELTLLSDGSIGGAEQFMRVQILPSGVINHGGRAQMSIADDGRVMPIEAGSSIQLNGPKEGWQAAMFIVVLSQDGKLF